MCKKKLYGQFEFRNILLEEAEQAAEIEKICFPPNEACSKPIMKERIIQAPELFLVAADKKTGKLAGFSGMHFLKTLAYIIQQAGTLCCLDWMYFRNTVERDWRESWCLNIFSEKGIEEEKELF